MMKRFIALIALALVASIAPAQHISPNWPGYAQHVDVQEALIEAALNKTTITTETVAGLDRLCVEAVAGITAANALPDEQDTVNRTACYLVLTRIGAGMSLKDATEAAQAFWMQNPVLVALTPLLPPNATVKRRIMQRESKFLERTMGRDALRPIIQASDRVPVALGVYACDNLTTSIMLIHSQIPTLSGGRKRALPNLFVLETMARMRDGQTTATAISQTKARWQTEYSDQTLTDTLTNVRPSGAPSAYWPEELEWMGARYGWNVPAVTLEAMEAIRP